ncbi:TonB-dependent receptor domain-containing protein [Pedobacter soli]|uniref:Outer membrane receptor proteins, mostly Fe transport n=1 Tax=Pedobacter soli TaxID=390242 RepID=A0A1G7A2P8_9SPHI|nr:TonB-dependent receptor [Pedobacter soli]SDE09082.1 Outer membrane receptor proteins, mostly Fe transport [Pedobacter soli]
MKKSNNFCFLLFFVLLILSFNARAQSKVNGTVIDSLKKPIEGVSIQVMTDKDTLRTTTDSKGGFAFAKVNNNKFYLVVKALGYKPFASVYEIESSKKGTVLDPIILKTEPIHLEDVEVKVKVDPIKIKKDTIEYNAAAYTVRENDKVEDLLKQLQGVEVDEKGAVTAMGKKMTKLRVNGEDFFTSNVEDYIRQLPADIIAKLQVIDDYGDEANFTGIKIGTPQKMLNLVTKPGMDKGVFGGVNVSSATNNAHNLGTNGSIWKKTKQIGFGGRYGMTDNEFSKLYNAGLNGNIRDKISKEFSVNANYNFNNNRNNSIQSTYLETFNPQGTIYDLRESANNSSSVNNSINLGLNGATKKNYFNAALSGTLGSSRNNAFSTSDKTGIIKQDLISNSGSRNSNPNIGGNINWSRRLSNNRRSLSMGFNFSSNGGKSNSSINDIIRYYNETTNVLVKDSLLNRLVENDTRSSNVGGNIQFSNSLKKANDSTGYSFINLSYRFSVSRSQNTQNTTVTDKFGASFLVDSLGQDYVSNFINQNISIGFNTNAKKISYNFGLNFSPSIIIGKYQNTGQQLRNYQLNFSPSGNLSYQIKENRSLSFGYNGYTSSPDFNKLQPIRNNNDVQNLIIGNPDLKATTSHSADLSYNQFGAKSGWSIMAGLSGSFAFNSVVSNTIFLRDTLNSLKQQTTYENVNGIYNMGGNYSLNRRLMTNKLSLSLNGNVGYSHNVFYTDNVLNRSSGINLSNAFRFNLNEKKFSVNSSVSYSFSSNTYSVLNQNIKNVQILALNGGASWIPGKRFRLNASASKSLNFGYNLNSGNPLLVNMGMNANFLKDNRLSFAVQANDLFNQGSLFQTSISNNSISENRTRFISRFVQATLTYNISTFGDKRVRTRVNNFNTGELN